MFFRVVGKREDGYHEIASLFQTITLGDILRIEPAKVDSFICNDPQIASDNIVVRARDLFRQKSGIYQPVKIELEKAIPIQAGLGGGSSNAATALWAMNQITDKTVDVKQLQAWGAELGSDVPFFFSKGTAYCTGRGEIIRELTPLRSRTFWVAKPKECLSTPLVYQHVRPDLLTTRDPEVVLKKCQQSPLYYFNDLEWPAFELIPKLQTIKNQLKEIGFENVVMTGSGTGFVCHGKVENPALPDVQFYKVYYIRRREGHWYEFPSFC